MKQRHSKLGVHFTHSTRQITDSKFFLKKLKLTTHNSRLVTIIANSYRILAWPVGSIIANSYRILAWPVGSSYVNMTRFPAVETKEGQ